MPDTERAIDRGIAVVEEVAGGVLAVVTALTFVSVVLRYVFAWSIPDSYDLSRLLLGVLIFWGIAVAGFRGDHIMVELFWSVLPPRGRQALDVLATLFAIGCMAVFAWAMLGKVADELASGETTYDIHLPVWPFYGVAWLGIVAGTVMLLLRLLRQLRGPPPAAVAPLPASH